jgi:ribosomal protein S18 acetylase RimI-like enzyme
MTVDVNTSIIPVEASELGRVRDLAERIWPECFAGILPAERIGPMVAEIYADTTLIADLVERGHLYWIAQRNGADVGYVSAYREKTRVWIKKLYLLASCRGSGLGKRLLATALAAFPDSASVGLYVNDGNAPAIAFYKAQGFVVEQHVPVKMGPFSFHDYVMAKAL